MPSNRSSLLTDRTGRPPRGRDHRRGALRPVRHTQLRRSGSGSPSRGPRIGQTTDPARRAAIDAFDVSTSAFPALGVPDRVVRLLGIDGIVAPTPVQTAVIPDAIAGRDVLGRARTGSGKTLAFGLPILTRLAGARSRPNHPRALVVVPTRELAGQVTSAVDPLAAAMGLRTVTVYGGTPYDRQIRRLSQGVDIVVATPGRLDDLVRRHLCRLDHVEIVALDEADHLCDLGFYPVVSELLAATPPDGQRLLLSATLDGDVDRLVRRHLTDPARHEVDPGRGSVAEMDHHVLVVEAQARFDVTTRLVQANPRSIVFTRTKYGASRLADDLRNVGVPAVDLHGDLSQRVRERNLDTFRTGRAHVVVATDVAARGIHVGGVGLVVHFDPAGEPKSYLHRSGRTARAGASGAVVTVATPGQARSMEGLHKRAGVDAKRVDPRSIDGPLTTTALVEAPAMAATAPARGGASRSRRGALRGPDRGDGTRRDGDRRRGRRLPR